MNMTSSGVRIWSVGRDALPPPSHTARAGGVSVRECVGEVVAMPLDRPAKHLSTNKTCYHALWRSLDETSEAHGDAVNVIRNIKVYLMNKKTYTWDKTPLPQDQVVRRKR